MNKIISPQAEDGHTDIANEIMEALAKIRIPGEARQVLDFIFRKTYGWHKIWDRISLSQFVLGTKLKKPTVSRALKKLELMNIIIIKKDNQDINNYKFNKHFDTWKPLSKKIIIIKKDNPALSKKIIGVIKKDKEQKKLLQKKITTKETIIERNPNISIFIKYFYDKFLEITGRKYMVQGGKDGKTIQRLLGTYTINELKDLCDKFFESTDEFVLKAGFSIGIFNSIVHKIISGDRTSQLGDKASKTYKAGMELFKKMEKEKNDPR